MRDEFSEYDISKGQRLSENRIHIFFNSLVEFALPIKRLSAIFKNRDLNLLADSFAFRAVLGLISAT